MITPDDGIYQHAWIYKHNHYFDFEVRACAGAQIRLNHEISFSPTQASYEIILGDYSNTKTTLTLKQDRTGTLLHEMNTPQILDCHALRPFRISWFNGHITISRGIEGEGDFFQFYPQDFFSIDTIALSSDLKAGEGLWEFSKEVGVYHLFIMELKMDAHKIVCQNNILRFQIDITSLTGHPFGEFVFKFL